MKKICKISVSIVLLTVGLTFGGFAQMPYNNDYSSWNWENQSQRNWQRYNKTTNTWINIDPPFSPASERLGEIVDVYISQDYTKAKGWKLVWAQFNGVYPYFILYNEHQGIARAFFYLDNDFPFSHVLATLSFHSTSNNPGIFSFGDGTAEATDQYLIGNKSGANDKISVVVPNVSVQTWCSADFPILFDNNINNDRYNSRMWVFKFYGCDNYAIRVNDKNGKAPPGSDKQHTISGGTNNGSTFNAGFAKFYKQISSSSDLLKKMQTSVEKIDDKSPKFLITHKKGIEQLKPVADLFSAINGVTAGASAIMGFFEFFTGTFDEKKSAGPTGVVQTISLIGTMDVRRTLGGNTLKIPGTDGSMFPPVSWSPFNCPVGYFNMKKTPTFKVTKPYSRLGCIPAGAYTSHKLMSGYSGRYRKYKLAEDIQLTCNKLPGMNLIDVHFAIVAKPNGTENRKYNIEDPYIAKYNSFNLSGQGQVNQVINPVYVDLEEGRFIVHKYDKDNNDVVYGTPYIPMNRFKGITFEVPEDTEVRLRVMAKFTSDKYSEPIVFQVDYDFKVQEENPTYTSLNCNNEQTNFLYSGYYTGATRRVLSSGSFATSYTAGEVVLEPGFVGTPNFVAQAINVYPSSGNTVVDNVNFSCIHDQNGRTAVYSEKNSANIAELRVSNYVNVYPNPSDGRVQVVSSFAEPLQRIEVYDLYGNLVLKRKTETEISELNFTEHPTGLYVIRMIYANQVIERKIIKQ